MLKSKKTRSVMVVSGSGGGAATEVEMVVGNVRVVERKRRLRRLRWGEGGKWEVG